MSYNYLPFKPSKIPHTYTCVPRFGPERRGGVTENGVVLAQDDVVERKEEDFQLKVGSKMLFIEVLA